jgi:hypothetical protein
MFSIPENIEKEITTADVVIDFYDGDPVLEIISYNSYLLIDYKIFIKGLIESFKSIIEEALKCNPEERLDIIANLYIDFEVLKSFFSNKLEVAGHSNLLITYIDHKEGTSEILSAFRDYKRIIPFIKFQYLIKGICCSTATEVSMVLFSSL